MKDWHRFVTSKDVRALVRAAIDQGWEAGRTRRGRPFLQKDGAKLILPARTGDVRAVKNCRQVLRHAGIGV